MNALAKLPIHMTVREFLDWEPGDGRRYELVDGEPRAMAPTNNMHGFLQAELARLIGNHLRQGGAECDVFTNPGVIPSLLSAHNFRIPDLGVTCSSSELGQPHLSSPVLLVEILSPSNQSATWSNVRAYASIPSLREILVLHSREALAELLRRSPDGAWPDEPVELRDELELASIGFRVSMAELYARTGLPGR